ncbi:MAG TPA: acetate--CoA ligase family protein [Microthrixaceae bacterium]|nr:acetate--CoA ligase family protein [Microthrixaceae bacterium]
MTSTRSEADSKALLAPFGVPFPDERVVDDADAAGDAADSIGYPVVAKLCGDAIAHKTERGLVRLALRDRDSVVAAATDLLAAATADDGAVGVLVAPMVAGNRELIAGVATDPQFGRTVLVGLGGVLAEAVADVAVRLVPIDVDDALEMLADLRTSAILDEFRGEPAVDRRAVADVLVALSTAAEQIPGLISIDLNPLILAEGRPVAVDALVELDDHVGSAS